LRGGALRFNARALRSLSVAPDYGVSGLPHCPINLKRLALTLYWSRQCDNACVYN